MNDRPERLCVIGAGTMGHGIAQVAALAGYQVSLADLDAAQLDRAQARVAASLTEGVERGKVSPAEREGALARLCMVTDSDSVLREADVVIEAVPERLDLKRRVFGRIDALAPPGALLASNTSSLPIAKIADATGRPGAVCGMHFFNPVPKMKLLEVVRGAETTEETVARAVSVGRRLGKEPIVVRDAPGFASSRLGIALALEAIRMLEQGVAAPEAIDKAMVLGYRHPMGPLRLTDLVGLDVRLAIAEGLHERLGPVFEPPALLRRLVAEGKLGRKTGEGFYCYEA